MIKTAYETRTGDNIVISSFTQGKGDTKRQIVVYLDEDVLDKLKVKEEQEGNSYFDIKSNSRVNEDGSKTYYLRYVTNKTLLRVHDVALGFAGKKGFVVDHINHYTLDCRQENLRIATVSNNNANRKSKGVFFEKRTGKFKTYGYDSVGKRTNKTFSKESEALRYRREQELSRFEEFAYIPQKDFRQHIDLLDKVIKKEITEEEALVIRLHELAQNPWVCIRYGLEAELKGRNIAMVYYYEDEEGFITRADGIHFRDIQY